MELDLGLHLDIKNGIKNTIVFAKEHGLTALQIFISSPRFWRVKEYKEKEVSEILEVRDLLKTLVIHTGYLVNLSSNNPETREKAIQRLEKELEIAKKIKANWVVVHMGKPKDLGREKGLELMVENLLKIDEELREILLLENTAGSGSELGHDLDDVMYVLKSVKCGGMCFDTAHAWGAGYNFEDLEEFDRFKQYIKVVHFNDSMVEVSSRKDRHHFYGKGKIGLEKLKKIAHYFKEKTLIGEIPGTVEEKLEAFKILRGFFSDE